MNAMMMFFVCLFSEFNASPWPMQLFTSIASSSQTLHHDVFMALLVHEPLYHDASHHDVSLFVHVLLYHAASWSVVGPLDVFIGCTMLPCTDEIEPKWLRAWVLAAFMFTIAFTSALHCQTQVHPCIMRHSRLLYNSQASIIFYFDESLHPPLVCHQTFPGSGFDHARFQWLGVMCAITFTITFTNALPQSDIKCIRHLMHSGLLHHSQDQSTFYIDESYEIWCLRPPLVCHQPPFPAAVLIMHGSNGCELCAPLLSPLIYHS